MSIRTASQSGIAGRVARRARLPGDVTTAWTRPPSWTVLPDVTGLQRFVGVHAVYPDSTFLALSASGSLGYTIDWGDGVSENVASAVTAQRQYDFAAVALNGTNAPVTLTDAGDVVTRTAHGYVNGNVVRFYNIVTTTGLTDNYIYYVISATANTFQVSLTVGGGAVVLTTDGTATLLPYKQAIVSIIPQSTGTLTALNLNIKHTQVGLPTYTSGWLDVAIAGANLATLAISGSVINVGHTNLERAQLVGSNTITDMSHMFNSCQALQSVPLFNTAAVTNMSNMFQSCSSLQSVPLFNTAAVTIMSNMFQGCQTLQSVPLFNTAAVTTTSSMFLSCASLQTVPLFNTAAVTNMSNMFQSCSSLQSVPLFNTAVVTTMSNMFNGCASLQTVPLFNTAAVTIMSNMFTICQILQTVPLFNTAAVTNMSSMFQNCGSLQTVPLFNTAAVTTMGSMFNGCATIQTVPLFNTAAVTNMSFMFNGARALQTVPLFNTAAVTNMGSMFQSCTSLQSVPLFNTATVTTISSMFNGCSSFQRVPLFNMVVASSISSMFSGCSALTEGRLNGTRYAISYSNCKLSKTALESIFTGLGKAEGAQTFTIGTNWGAPAVISLAGTTTADSVTVTMASTAGIVTGMQVTGTNAPLTTAGAVTLQDVGDTVTRTAHGLVNNDEVSFATIVTTIGIETFTTYFVVGAAANTFQVSLTLGGAAIALITDGSGSILYRATVTAINANVSVTLSRPATASGATTLAYRLLTTGTALLKGWTVSG